MSESPPANDSSGDEDEAVTVSVSPNGQATIPKAFREKLGIEAPGRVQFRETEDGQVVLERVPTVEEMQGFAARTGEATTDESATELLRAKRETERRERDAE
jgi:antitoxin PrlF